MESSSPRQPKSRLSGCSYAALVTAVAYVLSSGPMIGLCCWLREATGYDQFYFVFWLYLPLLALGHDNIVDYYIEWWVVDVFHTVGPG